MPKGTSLSIRCIYTIKLFISILLFSSPIAFAQKTEVKYCVDPNWLPYEAIQNGKHVGISADYITLFEKYSNIDFRLVPTTSWSATIDAVKLGNCDIVLLLNESPERSEYLAFSDVYFRSPMVLVSNDKLNFLQDLQQLDDKSVGVVDGYRIAEFVSEYYPDITFKTVPNELAGLKALQSGDIDVFLGSMLSINANLHLAGLNDIHISGWAGQQDLLRMGIRKELQHLLPSIDKAIAAISDNEHFTIYRKWINTTVVNQSNNKLLIIITVIAGTIILLLLSRNLYVARFNQVLSEKNKQLSQLKIELEERNEKLAHLSIHDTLTNLFNRHYFDQRFEQEYRRARRTQTDVCLIIIDIDYFKKINDEYGHSLGDKVLVELADILASAVREVDVLARWGGEEFVILTPATKLSDCHAFAQRLSSIIENTAFHHEIKITCSMGLAQLSPDETIEQWFDRADSSLYRAKEKGRNLIMIAKE